MSQTTSRIRLKLQFGGTTLGPGKIALMEGVARDGSISAAARGADMTYRRAWHLLHTLQDALNEPLLVTEVGGREKGGATLTPFAETLVTLYRQAETDAMASASELLTLLNTQAKG